MNISDYDGWIVKVGSVFLVAVAYEDTGMCRLSESPYNALKFDDREQARMIARRAGGTAVMFNPVSGVTGT